jgi:hypothetical protein
LKRLAASTFSDSTLLRHPPATHQVLAGFFGIRPAQHGRPTGRPPLFGFSDRFDARREVAGLSVWFPEAKFDTLRAAAELVAHHAGCARMHGIMPIESTDRIERAILVVDTNIINPDVVFILAPIFGHSRISRTID